MKGTSKNILAYQKKFGKTAKNTSKKQRIKNFADKEFGSRPSLLMSAYNCWNSLSTWREDIRRNEEFVFGDQFSDSVYDAKKCRTVTERQMLVDQGLQPNQYNIIRNVLRVIDGVWTSNKTMPSCIAQKDDNQQESETLTATLHTIYRKNDLWKLDKAQLDQLLITGAAIMKNHFAFRDGDKDVVNDLINPFTFFVDNTMKDPRYTDCSLVGCFYDLSIDDIVGLFSKGSKERGKIIRGLYGEKPEERMYEMSETFTDKRLEKDFFIPDSESYTQCRVIEVWRKESSECFWLHDYLHGTYYPDFDIKESEINAENARRVSEQSAMGVSEEDMLLIEYEWGSSSYWKYYFLTPYGEVLDEGVNPYWHEKPPIIFEFHDFFLGKIYPFVKDLIDTQKEVNNLSAISRLLSKHSAKSTLFMPIETIADEHGYGMDYIQDKITDYDSIIPYKAKGGQDHKPQYVNTVAQAFTPLNVVNMYLRLSENVSGVYGALQGQQPTSGTPAQMYAQQSYNSATSLNGIFESINSFRVRRDKMNVQLMQQFYEGRRYVFDKNSGQRLVYDQDKVRNIDVEIAIVENTSTPAYRLMINDLLMQLKQYDQQNMIDLRGLIEVGNFPFKDKLLDYLNKREQEAAEAMQAGQSVDGIPPDLQEQLSQYQFSPDIERELSNLPDDVKEMMIQQAPIQ